LGQRIALSDVARIYIEDGPPGIKSENARINGWTLVDLDEVDVGSYVNTAKRIVQDNLDLPTGYSIAWSGQYEYMERSKSRLMIVVPLTLGIIVILLYVNFRNAIQVTMLMGTLPVALVGSIWMLYLLGYNFSIAVGVGIIATAGVAIETGVIMLVYLNQAWQRFKDGPENSGVNLDPDGLKRAILEGSGQRVRPVVMTATATIAGLLPILVATGTGSEVMSRLAAPMIGGMLSALVLTLLVLPVVYFAWKRSRW
jgi:Cu(I)/Ag(I) efflux system membrane protein CusA/SilA